MGYIGVITHPLILTIDPNFQQDIQVGLDLKWSKCYRWNQALAASSNPDALGGIQIFQVWRKVGPGYPVSSAINGVIEQGARNT